MERDLSRFVNLPPIGARERRMRGARAARALQVRQTTRHGCTRSSIQPRGRYREVTSKESRRRPTSITRARTHGYRRQNSLRTCRVGSTIRPPISDGASSEMSRPIETRAESTVENIPRKAIAPRCGSSISHLQWLSKTRRAYRLLRRCGRHTQTRLQRARRSSSRSRSRELSRLRSTIRLAGAYPRLQMDITVWEPTRLHFAVTGCRPVCTSSDSHPVRSARTDKQY